ncbi:glycine zipper domain-containing protein [Chromobacterium sp. IIBBL 290-4]|uniref:glycine zipper domain-containing protein n=1 Tax=Chromobacterium sp. IIBBL 290-4 TaxID=2953890 RepID=UPI0020B73464|nr:glycine zipper domain-containing protein [Chromobacterium sp. IIBBL 290-4]UTH72584.1 hypothetical protein NKT35_13655 [Chromobacterium sp. IIBBL 290-4]
MKKAVLGLALILSASAALADTTTNTVIGGALGGAAGAAVGHAVGGRDGAIIGGALGGGAGAAVGNGYGRSDKREYRKQGHGKRHKPCKRHHKHHRCR